MKRPTAQVGRKNRRVKYRTMALSAFWEWRGKWKGISLPRWYRGYCCCEPGRGDPRRLCIMPKRVEGAQGVNGVQVVNASLGGWSKSLGTLAEWLCVRAYDDGAPVGDVRLTLRCVGGIIHAELKVQDGSLKLVGKERSPDLALAALEALLHAQPVPWEVDEYPIQRREVKKKGK